MSASSANGFGRSLLRVHTDERQMRKREERRFVLSTSIVSSSHPPFDGETNNWKSHRRGARLPHKHLTLPKHKPASRQREDDG